MDVLKRSARLVRGIYQYPRSKFWTGVWGVSMIVLSRAWDHYFAREPYEESWLGTFPALIAALLVYHSAFALVGFVGARVMHDHKLPLK